jgi:hypothetical protein
MISSLSAFISTALRVPYVGTFTDWTKDLIPISYALVSETRFIHHCIRNCREYIPGDQAVHLHHTCFRLIRIISYTKCSLRCNRLVVVSVLTVICVPLILRVDHAPSSWLQGYALLKYDATYLHWLVPANRRNLLLPSSECILCIWRQHFHRKVGNHPSSSVASQDRRPDDSLTFFLLCFVAPTRNFCALPRCSAT